MLNENKALIHRWFEEVWNKKRVTAIDELLAPNAVVHGLGPDLHGAGAFKPFHGSYIDAFPDLQITIDDVVAEGDKIAARWTGTGTHRGNGLGVPATGKTAHFSGMVFLRVEGGKLVEGWNTFDRLGMLQQLGVVTLPE